MTWWSEGDLVLVALNKGGHQQLARHKVGGKEAELRKECLRTLPWQVTALDLCGRQKVNPAREAVPEQGPRWEIATSHMSAPLPWLRKARTPREAGASSCTFARKVCVDVCWALEVVPSTVILEALANARWKA